MKSTPLENNMRLFPARALLATALVALALPAFSQAPCPGGTVPTTFTLPNGRTQTQCVAPAAILGRSNASPRSPHGFMPPPPVACPCFDADDVSAAAAGGYAYRQATFTDASGNVCTYREVVSNTGIFAAMFKTVEPLIACTGTPPFPEGAVNPNGCFSTDADGFVLLNPITVEQAQSCSAILSSFQR